VNTNPEPDPPRLLLDASTSIFTTDGLTFDRRNCAGVSIEQPVIVLGLIGGRNCTIRWVHILNESKSDTTFMVRWR
jgi:hypothetical protein